MRKKREMPMEKRIALIGLDGSGKSANIERMKQDESYRGYHFIWVRWEPVLQRPAYWLLNRRLAKKRKNEKQGQFSTDYRAKAAVKGKLFKSPIIRNIWMALALIDYTIQFYIKTGSLLVRNKKIVFDRFYLDLFVDQGLNFGYSPEKIAGEIRRYRKMFPRIERFIYIRVSPETCFRRKDDIPGMEYLRKRYAVYELLSREREWVSVDGERPFEEVYAEIQSHIVTA